MDESAAMKKKHTQNKEQIGENSTTRVIITSKTFFTNG